MLCGTSLASLAEQTKCGRHFCFSLWIFCSLSFCRWFCCLSAQPRWRLPLTPFLFFPIGFTQLIQLHHFLCPFPGKTAVCFVFFRTVYFDTFMNDFWWIFPLCDMFYWHFVCVKIEQPVGVPHLCNPQLKKHMEFASKDFSAWLTRTFHPVRGNWCGGHEIAGEEAWVCVCMCVCVSGSKWATVEKQVGSKSLNFPSVRTTALTSLRLFESEGSCLISLFSLFLFSFLLSWRSEKKKKRKEKSLPSCSTDLVPFSLLLCHIVIFFFFFNIIPHSDNGSARTLNVITLPLVVYGKFEKVPTKTHKWAERGHIMLLVCLPFFYCVT